MSKRDYKISKKAGDKMWTCKVTDSYGETHTNYFETTRQCNEHVYYTWENEVDRNFLKHANDDLLSKAIAECIQMDIDRGVEPNLD
jgi:hypothetical protein